MESVGELSRAHVDVDRFRQVLRNLLENALRHGKPHGRVVVRLTPEEHALRFAVEDDGPGISPEHLERVFDRFHRTDPSRDRATGGAGLVWPSPANWFSQRAVRSPWIACPVAARRSGSRFRLRDNIAIDRAISRSA